MASLRLKKLKPQKFKPQNFKPQNFKPPAKERMEALEELWAAVKEWRSQPLGYTPKIALAVEHMNKLERTTS